MATQGPFYATTASNAGDGGTPWDSPTLAEAEDGAQANSGPLDCLVTPALGSTDTINLGGFGFTFGASPVLSIVMEFKRRCDMGFVFDFGIRLVKSGVQTGVDKSLFTWPTGLAYATYTWTTGEFGTIVTGLDLADAVFGISIKGTNGACDSSPFNNEAAHIDAVRVTATVADSIIQRTMVGTYL